MKDQLPAAGGEGSLEEVIARRARNPDRLEDQSPEVVEILEGEHRRRALLAQFERRVNLARLEAEIEIREFLARRKGPATARAYKAALDRWVSWCMKHQIHPLDPGTAGADRYLADLADLGRKGLAPATVRQNHAAVSSFFTAMVRRHGWMTNPFLGVKRQSKGDRKAVFAVPTKQEVAALLDALDPLDAAFLAFLADAGLRVEGAAKIHIHGEIFTTQSKGKDVSGAVPARAWELVSRATRKTKQPFSHEDSEWWRNRVNNLIRLAFQAGLIGRVYSPHSFRHHYAVNEYRKDHDIHRLQGLLGHTSIATTEDYLVSLRHHTH